MEYGKPANGYHWRLGITAYAIGSHLFSPSLYQPCEQFVETQTPHKQRRNLTFFGY